MKRPVMPVVVLFLLVMSSFVHSHENQLYPAAVSSWHPLTNVGAFELEPSVKLTYQSMRMNLNFPIPGFPSNDFLFDEMDVTINKTAFWVGSLDLEIRFRQRFYAFLEAGVSLGADQSGTVATNFGGVASLGAFSSNSWGWTSAKASWWDINAGVGYRVNESFGIIAGFKCDKLSEKLETPAGAVYLSFAPPVFQEEYVGDLQISTRSPYVGVKILDSRWNLSLIWSPWVTGYTVKMPLRVMLMDSGGGFAYSNADSRYELGSSGGQLLEGYGETKFIFRENLATAFWVKGSWLSCRGNGKESFENVYQGTPGWEFYFATPGSADATSTLTRYLWAIGISAQLNL